MGLAMAAETVLSNGVEGVWAAWQGAVTAEKNSFEEKFEEYKKKFSDRDPMYEQTVMAFRESLVAIEQSRCAPSPLWQELVGFSKRTERGVAPGERAAGIRRLLKAVQRVTKFELDAELARRGGEWLGKNAEDPDACFAWDPLRAVCFHFGLAKTALGAWAWEVWGMSGPQIADRLKCAGVDKRMRDEMREFVFGILREREKGDRRDFQRLSSDVFWDWKKSKRGQAFNTSRAAKYGFTSYSRFGRACVLTFGVEPAELEWRVVQELVREFLSAPVERVSSESSQCAAVEESSGIQNSNIKIQNGEESAGIKEGDGDTKAQSH